MFQSKQSTEHATQIANTARSASRYMASASREQKDTALYAMAEKLEENTEAIIDANQQDIEAAISSGLSENTVARLRFGEQKILARARSLGKIAGLSDPVGQAIREESLSIGLHVKRVRVPLGVILMVYEARPHVTVNAGAFCLKSGNASILRGGSEAVHCNILLGQLWQESLVEAGLPKNAIQVVSGSHQEVRQLLELDEYIDLVIPRGGKGLIRSVAEYSRIPVLKHFEGICHVYVDKLGNLQSAVDIVLDSKCLMPEVCNAAETLLVSREASSQLKELLEPIRQHGVVLKVCDEARRIDNRLEQATDEDWRTEYLDMILSVRVVDGVEEAIEHINQYGSHHTDTILTSDESHAARFVREVDSGVVLVNASTMFCDGESLGMGAEIGISTDKLHARGPMGLEELTSYKFVIRGEGHVMGQWSETQNVANQQQ
ncbi:MAG: glutamate-5-semialdehyde dehydrogenase [Pirellulales bacterium]|nr:glutamate-5-semialdehyde dehydrogenase [Pirellulales bacterium]